MKLENKDFVWIYNGSEETISWGVVIDDIIIMQYGGFYSVNDFDDNGVAVAIGNYTNTCYIGGIVRYANSFTSAKMYYYHHITNGDRFIDHNTPMKVIASTDTALYLNIINTPLMLSVDEIEGYCGREVYIVT